ncbi:hypothetical protein E4634_11150 [Mangrovimicrobium sediminis]|uniref:VWA domain-containing protein n=1 Tax=Mangrovimicrobium sediminis TaxID=2562682 RepID=A0A4Z0M2A7_9GAMM|nr:vWA domain-containing protein [Haliea sp. SAOS-164]TGD73574.1 hypothetical protein E4634_11150 [Haliea sp. SAOS-164]
MPQQPSTPQPAAPELRVLVDTGSGGGAGDIADLRREALDLLASLLPEGARVGVWSYGDQVATLMPPAVVDRAWRSRLRDLIPAVQATGARADLPAALSAALDIPAQEGSRLSLLLLSSTPVAVADSPMINAGATRDLLADTLPVLAGSAIALHSIALSPQADRGLLEGLAWGSGGLALRAQAPEEVPLALLEILDRALPLAQLPLRGDVFHVDPHVEAFTALLIGPAGGAVELVAPDGTRFLPQTTTAEVTWARHESLLLARVPGPLAGDWQLRASGAQARRISVESPLRLQVDALPATLAAGQQGELALRVVRPDAAPGDDTELPDYAIDLALSGPRGFSASVDLSTAGAPDPDGLIRVALPVLPEPGRYRLLLRLAAAGAERELPLSLEVRPASDPTLVTRALSAPPDNLRLPMLTLAGAAVLALGALWLVLRRRQRDKLDTWRRRARRLQGENSRSA